MSSRAITQMRGTIPFLAWLAQSRYSARQHDPDIADFMFGNPQEMPIEAYVRALAEHVVPHDRSWFAYKLSESCATNVVATSLAERTGLTFEPEDVFMTNGGFAAIAVALRTICEVGDEVVFFSPPWFFYELLVLAAGAKPVRLRLEAPRFELPLDALAAAIGERTRAVLVNSPHNPSGRVYSDDELRALARVLADAEARLGRPLWILSDEAYAKITFDGRRAQSPAAFHPHTFVLYSYGKQLLAPGQRVGYAALPPTCEGREALRADMLVAQCATGFAFPNAILQYALEDIEHLSVDIAALERRRDRLVGALRSLGFETTYPEGTFYVLARDTTGRFATDAALVDALADRDTFVLPGSIVELDGWIRLSLTANDAMIDKGIEAFRALRAS